MKSNIGKNILALRAKKGIMQKDLAENIGIAISTLHYIEKGKGELTLLILAYLSQALGVTVDELVYGEVE